MEIVWNIQFIYKISNPDQQIVTQDRNRNCKPPLNISPMSNSNQTTNIYANSQSSK